MFILHSDRFFKPSKLQKIRSFKIIDTIIVILLLPTNLKDQDVQFLKITALLAKIGSFGQICG